MARRTLLAVVRYLQRLTSPANASGLSDAELLERYVRQRDEAAFELLLWRHGVLVLNVCRRVLHREQDAEDAFQATFLAFVRKAPTIIRHGSISSWLYKVAYRVALEARARAQKRSAREQPGGEALAIQRPPDPGWDEVRPILDEEVNRLPERLRRAFVLCYLEGKTNEEAARLLGCRPGTIFSRLSRGREMLRRRLVRRGVTLSTAVLTAALWQHAAEAVPTAPLVTATLRAALLFAAGPAVGGVSVQVTTLAEGVLRTMFITKLKMAALTVFVVGLLAAGGVFTQHALKAAPQPEAKKEAPLLPPNVGVKVEDKKASVRIIHPTPGGLEHTTRLTGHVRASAQQQVYAAVSGYLKRQPVDIGDRVKKGQLLAEVDAPLLRKEAEQTAAAVALAKGQVREAAARVATAEAEREAAIHQIKALERKRNSDKAYLVFRQAQAKRYEELLKERSIDARLVDEQENRREAASQAVQAAEEALTSARANIAVADSKIESAKAALESAKISATITQITHDKAQIQTSFMHIVAAFDGVVTQRNFDVGDFISANEQGTRRPLLTVQRTDLVRVVANVGQADVPLTRPGIPVDVWTDKALGGKLSGHKVSRIGFALDENTGTMPVEIDVPNPKGLLRPGMFISATLHLEKAPADGFTIPLSCLLGKSFVPGPGWVYIVRDGLAHRTEIKLGRITDDKVEVRAGVQATDRIVIDSPGLSGDVVPVEIKKEP